MEEKSFYIWIDFYKDFAQKLSKHKDDRPALIGKVKSIFEISGIDIPTIEKQLKKVAEEGFYSIA